MGPAIFLLAVPMVLEMMMESLFGIVNVFWVAHLGKEATATVGITESLLTMVFAVAMGLSMATTATVARRIGEKDHQGASVAAVQSIILGVVASIPVGIIAIAFAPEMLALMGASEGVIHNGTGYARVILGGNVVIMQLFLINAVFRGAGDASIAMRVLWIANQAPLNRRTVYVLQGRTAAETEARLASVQQTLSGLNQRGAEAQVLVTDIEPAAAPGAWATSINRQWMSELPAPKLPSTTASGAAGVTR